MLCFLIICENVQKVFRNFFIEENKETEVLSPENQQKQFREFLWKGENNNVFRRISCEENLLQKIKHFFSPETWILFPQMSELVSVLRGFRTFMQPPEWKYCLFLRTRIFYFLMCFLFVKCQLCLCFLFHRTEPVGPQLSVSCFKLFISVEASFPSDDTSAGCRSARQTADTLLWFIVLTRLRSVRSVQQEVWDNHRKDQNTSRVTVCSENTQIPHMFVLFLQKNVES